MAAAYAGVSGGFSANLLITGLDPMLSKLTEQAAHTLDGGYGVAATSNWYFMIASTLLITVVGTIITTKIVEPMLGEWRPDEDVDFDVDAAVSDEERSAFYKAMGVGAIALVGIVLLAVIPESPLRDKVAEGQPAINALNSFFHSIEILITLLFILPAIVYGYLTGQIKNDKDVAKMASAAMATMGAYIVLAFIAGQFVAYFNWTNLGAVSAVKGAGVLRDLGLTGSWLLLGFMFVSATMNMFVGSASAKWAFMAPIFVPMLMQMGISPELTQVSYRIGDSVTNIITPLMPYLPIIIIFAQKYDKKAGLGTILAAMIPYSIVFGILWTIMLLLWVAFDIPLGPGAQTAYELAATP